MYMYIKEIVFFLFLANLNANPFILMRKMLYMCMIPILDYQMVCLAFHVRANIQPVFLADDYFYSRWPVVESRLAKGGVRLATLLNRIFSEHKSIAEEWYRSRGDRDELNINLERQTTPLALYNSLTPRPMLPN